MKEQRPLKLSYFDEGVPLIITGFGQETLAGEQSFHTSTNGFRSIRLLRRAGTMAIRLGLHLSNLL